MTITHSRRCRPSMKDATKKVLSSPNIPNKELGLRASTTGVMDSIYADIMHKLIFRANWLLNCNKKTITDREIKAAVYLLFPPSLALTAIENAEDSVKKYEKYVEVNPKAPVEDGKVRHIALGVKAEVLFSVSKVKNLLTELSSVERCSPKAAIFLATVLQLMTTELFVKASEIATESRHAKTRITPRDLQLAIKSDEELEAIIPNILGGGVVNEIDPSLLPKRSKKAAKEAEEVEGGARKKKAPPAAPVRDQVDIATDNAIKRLCHRAGIVFVGKDVYDKVRDLLHNYLKKLVRDSLVVSQYYKKKTIQYSDVTHEAVLAGCPVRFISTSGFPGKLRPCGAHKKRAAAVKEGGYEEQDADNEDYGEDYEEVVDNEVEDDEVEDFDDEADDEGVESDEVEMEGGAGKRRFHPGTVAARDVAKKQKDGCLLFAKKTFAVSIRGSHPGAYLIPPSGSSERPSILAMAAAQLDPTTKELIHVSADALYTLQGLAENFALKILEDARVIASHGGKKSVKAKDIDAALKIKETACL